MLRILTDDDVTAVLDLEALIDAVEAGLISQTRGAVERPERPHYPIGAAGPDQPAAGTGLVMPAYIHGATYAVTKLVALHEDNPDRGLATIHAQLVASRADTGVPAALFDATLLTGARTGAIGATAVRALASGPLTLGVLGAGTQARWQTRAIGAVADVEAVRIYSPSDSRFACAADLREDGFDAEAVDTPDAAVADADVVVTATTSHEPVFPAEALAPEAIVVAVGAYTASMQELEAAVVEGASAVYADVPEEVATIGDIAEADLSPDELRPLGALLSGEDDPPTEGQIVVESVGSAVLDAAAAEVLLEAAEADDVGQVVDF